MRVSPGHSSSTPPLKKYVTCAYFSVSATWSWRAPAAASVSASVHRHLLLAERDRHVEVGRVARHRRYVEPFVDELGRELPASVGAEVEQDRRIVRPEGGPAVDDHRLEELIGHACVVARLHIAQQALCRHMCTHVPGDGIERSLRPFHALVAVHRPVAPDNRREPFERQLCEIGHGRRRRDIAPVREGVDPRALLHPESACQLE